MKTIIILLLTLRLLAPTCLSSEEIPLILGSADVKGWTEIAGGVRIQIESPKGSIESVKITAFGRDIEIPDAELAKLKGVIYSEISISHEGGYKELGGHTIYFILKFRDMFGGDPFEGDPMLEEQVRISVPKNAPVKVSKTRAVVKPN
jgi:hypothetical protein